MSPVEAVLYADARDRCCPDCWGATGEVAPPKTTRANGKPPELDLHPFFPGAPLGFPPGGRAALEGSGVRGRLGSWGDRASRPQDACVALARRFVCAGGGPAAAGEPSQNRAKRECSGSPSWRPEQSYLSLCAFSFSSVYSRLQWLSLRFAFQSQASPLAALGLGCPFTPSVSSSSACSSAGSKIRGRCL